MKRWFKIAVPLGIAAVMLSVLAIGFGSASIDAAPGGNGNGKGNGHANGNGGGNGHTTATMWVEGNPFAAWGVEDYTVNGSGFHSDQPVFISLASPGCCASFITVANSDGNIAFTRPTGAPGTYEADAFQYSSRGKLTRMTSVSFLVAE